MTDLAEVDRVHAVELDDERCLLPGLGPAGIVAVGSDGRDEDFLDFIFARAIEDEGVVEACREERRAVPRRLALRPWKRTVVGMAERHDVAADPASRRSDDSLVRVRDDDRFAPAQPD